MKYFLRLSYHGGRYHGWQRQNNVISVQEVLEDNLSKLLKETVTVVGCGRTDAGVHASEYYGHIKVNEISNKNEFLFRINKILPQDIAVHDLISVSPNAHAQHDAIWRTYQYFIHRDKNPLINQTSAQFDFKDYDRSEMKKAFEFILSISDFKSVCKNPAIYKTTVCTVREATFVFDDENKTLVIQFTANRFLRSMVRLLVAKIIKIGLGKLPLEDFREHLISGISFPYYDPAPPQGLHLSQVVYKDGVILDQRLIT